MFNKLKMYVTSGINHDKNSSEISGIYKYLKLSIIPQTIRFYIE